VAQKRRIVPDASVLLPAYFRETLNVGGRTVELTPQARRLRAVIQTREVTAFAPDMLLYEFTHGARDKGVTRSGASGLSPEEIKQQFEDFLSLLPIIVWVAADALADDAWHLMTEEHLSPPDSWYLACARLHDAELWISHEHQDRFAEHARRFHPRVFLLSEDSFDLRT
jgi:predicted nucleic acid-binding protein